MKGLVESPRALAADSDASPQALPSNQVRPLSAVPIANDRSLQGAVEPLAVSGALTAAITEQAVGKHTAPAKDGGSADAVTGQASSLIAFVLKRVELFHDVNKAVYSRDLKTFETRRLDSRQFKDWLIAAFYQSSKTSPREQSLREAMSTLTGIGRFQGQCSPVWIRVGLHEGAYYLDLGEPGKGRAVKVTADSWTVVSHPPVRFFRPETLLPLPEPKRGGSLADLWRLTNIPRDNHLLTTAWLMECLRPDTPFPVLEIIGEQGSAKSTTQTLLRRLIDPNACDLRGAPKSVEDLFVSAGTNWVGSFENISHLSAALQDALCILSTGGGFAKRKLYSDSDEIVINVKRPVVLNGIAASITAQDLIDRTITVEVPRIIGRKQSNELWAEFDRLHGSLLGGLLTLFAATLRRMPRVSVPADEMPRLAEFALLGVSLAVATNRPASAFLGEFRASRAESIARTIDANPVASAIIDLCGSDGFCGITGSAKDLMEAVSVCRQVGESWPRSPKGFADALRRAAPALRQMGIECRSLGKIGGMGKWTIEKSAK